MTTKLIPPDIGEHMTYEPNTGFIIKRSTGKRIGGLGANGYIRVHFRHKFYPAHRIAWFLQTGEQPPLDLHIDHINRVTGDNRWENLRLATVSQNLAYRKVRTRRLPRGVNPNGSGFSATICHNKVVTRLGTYRTPEEASVVFQDAFNRRVGTEWNISNLKAA